METKHIFQSRKRERRLDKKAEALATDEHGKTRKENTAFRAGCVSDGCTHPLGAKSKVANGGVAVGLPHRNSSVLKQADPNKQ